MVSTKKALDCLVANGLASAWKMNKYKEYSSPEVQSDKLSVSYETYGKNRFIYFRCKSPEIAKEVCHALREAGGKPGLNWNGGLSQGCIELPVS